MRAGETGATIVPRHRPLIRALLVPALAAVALLAAAGPASAGKQIPCWKLVLQDSYSGHFDTIYPHSCYRQAIERIPPTMLIYSDTRDEIQAAASAALNGRKYTARAVANTGTGPSATPSTSNSGSSGVPTAIIVLGGVAVALLLVGGAGELWRRTRRNST